MRSQFATLKKGQHSKYLPFAFEELERTLGVHDENIQLIFETISQLIEKKNEPREPVGFKIDRR